MNEVQQKLFEITKAWNEYEDSMGEQAALELACQEQGTDSDWYYENMVEEHEVVNKHLRELYDARENKGK